MNSPSSPGTHDANSGTSEQLSEEPELFKLFELANSFAPSWLDRLATYQATLSKDENEKLALFINHVQERGRVSINMGVGRAAGFFEGRAHLNIHEVAALNASKTKRDPEEELKALLGKWYEKRIAFEDSFEEGRNFRYGALNTGGSGISRYGEICVVMTVDFMSHEENRVAWIATDSLIGFVSDDAVFDQDLFFKNVAASPHHSHMTAIKTEHKGDSSSWPELICNENDYVEAIFVRPLEPPEVQAARICSRQLLELEELIFRHSITPGDAAVMNRIERFESLQKILKEQGKEIEVVDNG